MTDALRIRALEMRSRGIPAKATAAAVGVSVNTVYRWTKEGERPPAPPPDPHPRCEKCGHALRGGLCPRCEAGWGWGRDDSDLNERYRALAAAVVGQAVLDGRTEWFHTETGEAWLTLLGLDPEAVRERMDRAVRDPSAYAAMREALKYLQR